MNQSEAQQYTETIQAQLDSIPEEVQDFLYSDAYHGLIEGLAKYFSLNEQQKKVVDEIAFNITANIETNKNTIEQQLATVNITGDLKDKLLTFINEYFVKPSLDRVNEAEALESEGPEMITTEKTKPTDGVTAFNGLGERLNTAAILTPTKRDYSIEKPTEPTGNTPEKKFDPYHEPIDEK